jgi:transcriptional regulator with XRE-family HTH domain
LPIRQHLIVDNLATPGTIHDVDEFRKILKKVIKDEFDKSQRSLALEAGISHSLISRILTNERGAAPAVVGKIAGACSKPSRQALITAYLRAIAAEIDLQVDVAVTLK